MHNSLINRSGLALLAAILHCLTAGVVWSDDASTVVTLHLANGRKAIGQIDSTTDDTHLVIRESSSSVVVRTRVPWISIGSIDIENQSVTVTELQQRLLQLQSASSAFAFSPSTVVVQRGADPEFVSVSPYRGNVMIVSSDAPETISPPSFRTPSAQPRVRSLQFFTQPANWDNDTEIDGLLIQIRSVDEVGRLVPVNGTLELKLMGLSQTLGGQVQQGLSPVEFPVLDTWSQTVRRADFTNEGAVYRLEFRHYRPGRDVSVDPVGLSKARLAVPGVGAFDASEDVTVLRPYSYIRDQHQMFRGTRMLSGENSK
ncbi:MAG: hypothetical protein O2856_20480 [Planctomycetota bacterium]|nr:hypothetical protein [Planctomycetota bacterium]